MGVGTWSEIEGEKMKQVAQYQDGRLELQEVPAPQLVPGGVLVRTTCSIISPGTEKMKLEQARMSLLQKARARPDQVRKVLDTARTLGWKSAYEKVKNRLESPTPLGYSAAGIVEAVDPLNRRFRVGDRVACGGAECAFHAEYLSVPDLLASPIPEGVEDWQAAYTTLAAISMQGVRQTDSKIGDRVLVIGQGLVGLLVTRLLQLSGVRVLASDYDNDRLRIAETMGAERVVNPGVNSITDCVSEWTSGEGVDAVVICASGKGKGIADTAIESVRERGLLVIVGNHDAELSWKTAYMKDIQVRYSKSYGPGRYDPSYEWGGIDYPIGHVRWTENRNFEACLQLMKTGQLDLAALTTRRASFDTILQVYEELVQPGNTDVGVVLEYGSSVHDSVGDGRQIGGPLEKLPAMTLNEVDRVHVLGAGNFARTMLLPHLKGHLRFGTVVNGTGLSANHVKDKFGFETAGTDPGVVFGDNRAAVVIATRHHLHAPFVLNGLKSDQHVFVEKPLCLDRDELEQIDAAMTNSRGSVMVGFNRRFAPATVEAKKLLSLQAGPKSMTYHVFAGELPKEHWYANIDESGGRILGEACHFFDFFTYMIGSRPMTISALPIGNGNGADCLCAQVGFADGSMAQLLYTASGDHAFPKETWCVFCGNAVVECDNFQKLTIYHRRKKQEHRFSSKGHAEEMKAWREFLIGKVEHPLPYSESRKSMLLTFAALRAVRENKTIGLDLP
jgi:threonine dehydrogenase-like Zn-dependent dehydrogenase/predicted dehydrogenase